MKADTTFILNQELVKIPYVKEMTLLSYLRTHHLTGLKDGCGEGACGACSILLGTLNEGELSYRVVPACLVDVNDLSGKHVVSIEGLRTNHPTPLEQAFVTHGAIQCGFCTPGFIISITGFLLTSKEVDFNEGINAVSGNLCRCSGYIAIIDALRSVCQEFVKRRDIYNNRITELIEWGVLPTYFDAISTKLATIQSTKVTLRLQKINRYHLKAGGTGSNQQQRTIPISYFSQSNKIVVQGRTVVIGAQATIEGIRNNPLIHEHMPDLSNYLVKFGNHLIRNKATVGGNLVTASPIGDMSVLLLALGARVVVKNMGSVQEKQLELDEFFLGNKLVKLELDEYIEEIIIPKLPNVYHFNYEKISLRQFGDVASCNSACLITARLDQISSISLSMGGVAPLPKRMTKTEAFLHGKHITKSVLKTALGILDSEIDPIGDIRGSESYKRHLARQLFLAHLEKIWPSKLEKWYGVYAPKK